MNRQFDETMTEQQLLEKIEHLRTELHRSVNDDPRAFTDPHVQKLSQHLDELIAHYTKKKYSDAAP
ncbi:MAG: hypothetical protein A6D91_05090 [Bacillaceae bacterium G1]|nr:hypothetical protein [Bacillota bacterium]OJF16838.1 MAG: hypothetical protein A6D91_05090 [Bacillaceae bacterium G1]